MADRIPDEDISQPEPSERFDDRESFRVAEAVLAAMRARCGKYADDEAVWEAFINWRGDGAGGYLRGIRAGRKFIFYSVIQDMYDFAQEICGEDVTCTIGERLAATLLDQHMPDILQATLARTGALAEQIMWLVSQFAAGATGEIYRLEAQPPSESALLCISLSYKSENEMVDYLRESGHNPERAFANSFNVFRGALRVLLSRAIYGFAEEQFESRLQALQGRFLLELRDENRFHYENIIDALLEYVRKLRERERPEVRVSFADAEFHVSERMRGAWARVRKAAASDETVLLCGESGTGKSYYARVIHDIGARRNGPFVEVGMTSDVGSDNLIQSNLFGHVRGAFTGADDEKQGLFALADGGTIFLDEVGDASPELQAKLLRVIEKKSFRKLGGLEDISVDVRIIAATNKDLTELVGGGQFREDLLYRLNVIRILLPPLRERAEDFPALVQRLFERVCREANKLDKRLSDEAFAILRSCDWPGNIRELENALRHAVAFSETAEVRPEELPEAITEAVPASILSGGARIGSPNVIDRGELARALSIMSPPAGTRSFEWQSHIDYARREYLRALIEHYGGNLREIAKHWDRSSENTLLKLIRNFGLEEELRAARKAGR